MKLHNTLTRHVDDLKPLADNTVRFYSCGPTVYDHAHIGNLRAYVFADVLHRALEASGFDVHRVMNYTDIDDKTVRRSHEKYPKDEPMIALKKLTEEYIQIFLHDMQKLGNRTDNITYMAATDNIEAMQKLIAELHQTGFAYIADDGVYFSIDAYKKSGKKYGQLVEITTANTGESRIQNDEYDKESAHDFALWKTKKPGEPAWPFTLDGRDLTGRPGWHIECSAMSREGLGQPFDLHTGGVDNIFPHHENEIAQSTAGQDIPVMAQFFVHNEHLLVEDKKMAKSANNFYTLEDVMQKGYDPLTFRLLLLQAHYRSQVNFSWNNLDAAKNRLAGYRAMAALKWQANDKAEGGAEFMQTSAKILDAIKDDLDTPAALAILSEFADTVKDHGVKSSELSSLDTFLQFLDSVLGLNFAGEPDITGEQKNLIEEREQARTHKEWEKSDQLREQLTKQGIALNDTPNGPIWYRQ
jgi:cysteinyl-tRNA synthetase